MKTYDISQLRNTIIKDYKNGNTVITINDIDLIDFMLTTIKNAADNANNHLQLKFQLMEKGVI